MVSRPRAGTKAALFDRAAAALEGLGAPVSPAWTTWFVPGRLEVLGKHTDYAGGRSLLCAVERGFCVMASPRDDSQLRIVDAATTSVVSFEIDADLGRPGGWANYPATVARRVARNFCATRGADIAFESNLPQAAGMSSSSALMIAVFLVLADVNRLESLDLHRRTIRTREDLAGYLATIENGQTFGCLEGDAGVGTFGGSEDHTAILCCEADHLAQYSFSPVRRERSVMLPHEYTFVIAASGITAEKTGAARDAYNRAAAMTRRILELWCAATGRADASLAAAIASDRTAADRIRQIVGESTGADWPPDRLLDRFEQFFEESERIIPETVARLAADDVDGIGPLVDRSQRLAERLLGNQIPETIALARSARDLGAAASSAFGAGFGGSVWALVPAATHREFLDRWASAYRHAFPFAAVNAEFFVTRPGPAAIKCTYE